ncbi:MAG: Uma2 family endonuclease [Thermomicrobiales bacterium]|nr:Uma2 family endonuclease [Thermomicrobiales bacterium]
MQAGARWTVESVAQLPEDERFEILRGEALPASPTGFEHSWGVSLLIQYVGTYVRTHKLGRASGEDRFVLPRDPDVVLAPDLAFVRADRLPLRSEWKSFLQFAPDLVGEVVSPHDKTGTCSTRP